MIFFLSLPEMDIKEAQEKYNQHRKKSIRRRLFSSKGNAEDVKTIFIFRVSLSQTQVRNF